MNDDEIQEFAENYQFVIDGKIVMASDLSQKQMLKELIRAVILIDKISDNNMTQHYIDNWRYSQKD